MVYKYVRPTETAQEHDAHIGLALKPIKLCGNAARVETKSLKTPDIPTPSLYSY